jgi:hypothetical protein
MLYALPKKLTVQATAPLSEILQALGKTLPGAAASRAARREDHHCALHTQGLLSARCPPAALKVAQGHGRLKDQLTWPKNA